MRRGAGGEGGDVVGGGRGQGVKGDEESQGGWGQEGWELRAPGLSIKEVGW